MASKAEIETMQAEIKSLHDEIVSRKKTPEKPKKKLSVEVKLDQMKEEKQQLQPQNSSRFWINKLDDLLEEEDEVPDLTGFGSIMLNKQRTSIGRLKTLESFKRKESVGLLDVKQQGEMVKLYQ